MSALRFTVPGDPVPWERVRSNGRAHFTAPRTRCYQAQVQFLARKAGAKPLEGPVTLTARFFRGSARRCDLDNLAKSVQDALNGIAYADDSQIVRVDISKAVDREHPRAEIAVEAA